MQIKNPNHYYAVVNPAVLLEQDDETMEYKDDGFKSIESARECYDVPAIKKRAVFSEVLKELRRG